MSIRRRLQLAVVLLLAMLTVSVAGYRLLGGPSVRFLNALYMAVITFAGVGYAEVVDTSRNPGLRVFNILVVFFDVTIMVYVLSVVTAFLVEGELSHVFGRRKMEKNKGTQGPLHRLRAGGHRTLRHRGAPEDVVAPRSDRTLGRGARTLPRAGRQRPGAR